MARVQWPAQMNQLDRATVVLPRLKKERRFHLQQVIENQDNYELDIKIGADLDKEITGKYDLVICHQLPSKSNPAKMLFEKTKNTSKLFFVGSSSDFKLLNEMQKTVQFDIKQKTVLPEAKRFFLFRINTFIQRQLHPS